MNPTADNTATAPATPTYGPDLDGVLAAGEELRASIAEKMWPCRERYLDLAGDLHVMPVYEALHDSLGYPPRVLAEKGGGEDAEVARRVVEAYDALESFRRGYELACYLAVDRGEDLTWGGEFPIRFAPGSNRRARALVEDAATWFPIPWVEASNAAGPLRATLGEGGEYVSQVADGYPAGAVCVPLEWARLRVGRDDPTASATHELAHRFQDCVPGVAAVERAFYERRTAGAPARRLDAFGSDGLYRDGGFCDPYAGRDPDLDAEPSEGHEVLPVGLSAMLGGDLEEFEAFVRHADREHEAFVLGALACL